MAQLIFSNVLQREFVIEQAFGALISTPKNAPVSAEKRPAVMDKNIIHVINAKWTVLAEAIMENRLNYENIYYDLKEKGNIKPCLIIFHYINFIFHFS